MTNFEKLKEELTAYSFVDMMILCCVGSDECPARDECPYYNTSVNGGECEEILMEWCNKEVCV